LFSFSPETRKNKIKILSTQKNLRNIFEENFALDYVENLRVVSGRLYKRFPRKLCQSRLSARPTSSYSDFYLGHEH
jgi:hypothetical protein